MATFATVWRRQWKSPMTAGTLHIDGCLSARATSACNVRGGELRTDAGAAKPRAAVAISTKRTNEKRCVIRT